MVQDLDAFSGACLFVERKRVGNSARGIVWQLIVSFLGKLLTFGGVRLEQHVQSRVGGFGNCVIGCVPINLPGDVEKLSQVISRSINPKKIIERFAPARWIFSQT